MPRLPMFPSVCGVKRPKNMSEKEKFPIVMNWMSTVRKLELRKESGTLSNQAVEYIISTFFSHGKYNVKLAGQISRKMAPVQFEVDPEQKSQSAVEPQDDEPVVKIQPIEYISIDSSSHDSVPDFKEE